jgi:hypothetical protein
MKRFVMVTAAAVAMAAWSGTAGAQDTTSSEPMLKSPVFIVMGGAITSNAIHKPPGVTSSTTKANVRFQTVVPTATKYFSLVAGVQWSPQSTGHGPIVFYGAIIPIPGISEATNGVLGISLDPLGVTTGPGSQGTNFFGEVAVVAAVGSMMAPANNPFHSFFLFFLLDQQIARTPKIVDPTTGETRNWRFSPGMLYGAGLQIAPWGK